MHGPLIIGKNCEMGSDTYVGPCNYQGADCLSECVKSILTTNTEDIELNVVNNASPDNSAELVRRSFPSVKLIQLESNVGYSEACNIAASYRLGEE